MSPALLALLLLSVGAGGPGGLPAGAVPWDGETYRAYREARAGISFEVPLAGFHLEARQFDAERPGQALHLFTLSGPEGPEVTVDLFANPARLDLHRWFEEHLAFLRDEQTRIASVVMSSVHTAGMLLSQPRAGGAYARLTAVFAHQGRVFRVTCLNQDDPRARKVFHRVIDSFDPESGR